MAAESKSVSMEVQPAKPVVRTRIDMSRRKLRRHASLSDGVQQGITKLTFASEAINLRVRTASICPREEIFGVDLPFLLRKERDQLGLYKTPRDSADTSRDEKDANHSIPHLVSQTVEYLSKTEGYKTAGIFRLCGKHSDLEAFQNEIDQGAPITFERLSQLDMHTVGDVLRTFLRCLPRPIVPVDIFYPALLEGTKLECQDEFNMYLSSLVKILPIDCNALLDYLCQFFNRIIEHAHENKMGASNLAIIFSPSFFGQCDIPDKAQCMAEIHATSRIVQSLIEFYPLIFNDAHHPMKIYTVIESFSDDNISLLKGESIRTFITEENSGTTSYIAGKRLKSVNIDIITTHCKPQKFRSYTDSLKIPEESVSMATRLRALENLVSFKGTSSPQSIIPRRTRAIECKSINTKTTTKSGRTSKKAATMRRSSNGSKRSRRLSTKSINGLIPFTSKAQKESTRAQRERRESN